MRHFWKRQPQVNTVEQNLIAAQGRVQRGWCKGTMQRKDELGRIFVCAMGATNLHNDCGGAWLREPQVLAQAELLMRAIPLVARRRIDVRCYGRVQDAVTEFNDHPATTKEDVVMLFQVARELARGTHPDQIRVGQLSLSVSTRAQEDDLATAGD